ncbi:glutathione S-transferase family protein [Defluviimonas sp. SAOS-178_SWC]|uniref:glutathione S-transferase family protein n=1 Tax=Defluviimonas sp. SAOS-178_SWC TaxID=3121287 RepID=UPI003221EEA8
MITLYTWAESLYCAKVRIALRHKGVAFREVAKPENYLDIVPQGSLPGMDHDGFILGDSEAIIEYLEERFDGPPLLPEGIEARARMRERARYHDTRLEPALRGLFPHVAPSGRDPAVVVRQEAEINKHLGRFVGQLAAGADLPFGLGDCGLPASFAWIDLIAPAVGADIIWPEQVRAYRARVEAVPAVAEEMTAYRPHMLEWMARKLG